MLWIENNTVVNRFFHHDLDVAICFELLRNVILLCYILVTPMIIPEVMDQVQDEGGTISLTCSATGQPLPIISWYFNGVPINKSNTMKYTISVMLLNATTISSTLTVMNVESSDVGTYTCNATNVVSTDISARILTVNGELIATITVNVLL